MRTPYKLNLCKKQVLCTALYGQLSQLFLHTRLNVSILHINFLLLGLEQDFGVEGSKSWHEEEHNTGSGGFLIYVLS